MTLLSRYNLKVREMYPRLNLWFGSSHAYDSDRKFPCNILPRLLNKYCIKPHDLLVVIVRKSHEFHETNVWGMLSTLGFSGAVGLLDKVYLNSDGNV